MCQVSCVILCPVGEILRPDRHADDDVHAAGHEAVDQREHEVRREERRRELAPAEALDPRVNILQKIGVLRRKVVSKMRF